MRVRLEKEFRPLVTAWIPAIMIILSLWVIYDIEKGFLLSWFTQLIASFLMGAIVFGVEFECGTMERLLSQPIERKRVWREKMGILAFAIFIPFLLLSVFCMIFLRNELIEYCGRRLHWPLETYEAGFLFFFIMSYGSAFCAGPFMALTIRKTHTAFWAAVTSTAFIVVVWLFFVSMIPEPASGGKFSLYSLIIPAWIPLLIWNVTTYLLARRKFMQLEVGVK